MLRSSVAYRLLSYYVKVVVYYCKIMFLVFIDKASSWAYALSRWYFKNKKQKKCLVHCEPGSQESFHSVLIRLLMPLFYLSVHFQLRNDVVAGRRYFSILCSIPEPHRDCALVLLGPRKLEDSNTVFSHFREAFKNIVVRALYLLFQILADINGGSWEW